MWSYLHNSGNCRYHATVEEVLIGLSYVLVPRTHGLRSWPILLNHYPLGAME